MTWNELWPKQRANVRRKKASPEDLEYRKRVRKNKQKAAIAASNARISAERAERAKQREANAKIIKKNERAERRKEPRKSRRKGGNKLKVLDNYGPLR